MEVFDVNPATLRVPPSRKSGADPAKLMRQIAKYGKSTQGMPHLFVYRGSDGELVIYDGVTRAVRIAKLLPGQTVRVEVIDTLKVPGAVLPQVGDVLP